MLTVQKLLRPFLNLLDESCSLNERTVTSKGNGFLKEYYNDVINNDADSIFEALTEKLKMYSSY